MCPRGRPRGQGRPRGLHLCYLCFIEFKVGNWSEKKTSLLCFVLFANMSLVLVQFPIPIYINLKSVNSRAHQNER